MDIDGLASLEREIEKKRREVGAAIRAERERRELSLRDVGRDLSISASTVLEVESGHTPTSTVSRVVQYLKSGQQNSRSRGRPTV